jgi:hypothetical protein
MILVREASECVSGPKICDARLAVPSNQDIVLNVSNVNMGFVRLLVSPTGVRAPCKISN